MSKFKMWYYFFIIYASLTGCVTFSQDSGGDSSKIDAQVADEINGKGKVNVIVVCQQPTTNQDNVLDNTINSIRRQESNVKSNDFSKSENDGALTDLLQNVASSTVESLASVFEILKSMDAKHHFNWLSQEIIVLDVEPNLLSKLSSLGLVERIYLDELVENIQPNVQDPVAPPPPLDTSNPFWNLELVNSQCGSINCTRRNVTIGIIGTGVKYDHEELIENFVNTEYGWWDATGSTTRSQFPDDVDGRETSIAGVAVGKTIGVAPNARWMACRACPTTIFTCTRAFIQLCATYMLCPWKWDDESHDKITMNCSHRPHVIIYGGGSNVGGQIFHTDTFYLYDYIKQWNNVGILSVFGIGNGGPTCNSGYIPGSYPNTLGVGAVDISTTVWGDGSRGPVMMRRSLNDVDEEDVGVEETCSLLLGGSEPCAGATAMADGKIVTFTKPDLVAPGVDVISADISDTTTLAYFTGTQIAAGHVAGVIAGMICAHPEYKWTHKSVRKAFMSTADTSRIDLKGDRGTAQSQYNSAESDLHCNVIMSKKCNGFPNEVYGAGVLTTCAAVEDPTKTVGEDYIRKSCY